MITFDSDYERERDFVDQCTRPAQRRQLLAVDDSGGEGYDLWLAVERGQLVGYVDDCDAMIKFTWAPETGLDADRVSEWATRRFGKRHAKKFATTLANMACRVYAAAPPEGRSS